LYNGQASIAARQDLASACRLRLKGYDGRTERQENFDSVTDIGAHIKYKVTGAHELTV